MKKLECGCELSPGGKLVSLCSIHAEHMSAVNEMSKHPRAHGIDREYQKDLVKILAPVVLARVSPGAVLDPETSAEKLFQCVHSIMRRLD